MPGRGNKVLMTPCRMQYVPLTLTPGWLVSRASTPRGFEAYAHELDNCLEAHQAQLH